MFDRLLAMVGVLPVTIEIMMRIALSKMGIRRELLIILYIGVIAWLAQMTNLPFILFPALGALAYDTLKRPHGTWANAPKMLIITPILTGTVGTLIAQHFQYGVVPILLATAAAMLIIGLLQSPISPAIAVGVLPIALDVTSWRYPLSLLVGLVLLVAFSTAWRRIIPAPLAQSVSDSAADATVQMPESHTWLPYFAAFLVAAALLAQFTGWRFILFPPLIVIGFEMFAHSAVCPWTGRPIVLTVACALSALAGVELVLTVGNTPLAVAISALVSIFVLRLFDLYAPPILAVGLLSFLIPHANYTFPIAIGIGTLLLVVFFLAWNQFHKRTETRNA